MSMNQKEYVNKILGMTAKAAGLDPEFAKAITPQDEPEVCDVCGFNLELIGHAAQCPKRTSEPDGPEGRNDGYTDAHDPDNCADPDCTDPACVRDRIYREGDRLMEEKRNG